MCEKISDKDPSNPRKSPLLRKKLLEKLRIFDQVKQNRVSSSSKRLEKSKPKHIELPITDGSQFLFHLGVCYNYKLPMAGNADAKLKMSKSNPELFPHIIQNKQKRILIPDELIGTGNKRFDSFANKRRFLSPPHTATQSQSHLLSKLSPIKEKGSTK